jgi:hypothetical protein
MSCLARHSHVTSSATFRMRGHRVLRQCSHSWRRLGAPARLQPIRSQRGRPIDPSWCPEALERPSNHPELRAVTARHPPHRGGRTARPSAAWSAILGGLEHVSPARPSAAHGAILDRRALVSPSRSSAAHGSPARSSAAWSAILGGLEHVGPARSSAAWSAILDRRERSSDRVGAWRAFPIPCRTSVAR